MAGMHTAFTVIGATDAANRIRDSVLRIATGRSLGRAVGEYDWDALEGAVDRLEGLSDEARQEAIEQLRRLKEKREGKSDG